MVGTYILFGLLGTIAIPACAFMLLEDHTFIDAVYFVVISLTTVVMGFLHRTIGREMAPQVPFLNLVNSFEGFGDITPSFKDDLLFDLYRVAVLIWIFFGLAYIGGLGHCQIAN